MLSIYKNYSFIYPTIHIIHSIDTLFSYSSNVLAVKPIKLSDNLLSLFQTLSKVFVWKDSYPNYTEWFTFNSLYPAEIKSLI